MILNIMEEKVEEQSCSPHVGNREQEEATRCSLQRHVHSDLLPPSRSHLFQTVQDELAHQCIRSLMTLVPQDQITSQLILELTANPFHSLGEQ